MGLFSGIEKAKASADANYFRPGRYWAKITSFRVKPNRKGDENVALECTVVRVLEDDEGSHKVGEEVSHLFREKSDYFLGELKAFVQAVCEIPVDNITEDECNLLVDEEQPLAGSIIEISARSITIQNGPNAGKPFTKVKFVGSVGSIDALEALDDEVIEKYFPNDELVLRAEEEAKED